jgi:hypothetical protein
MRADALGFVDDRHTRTGAAGHINPPVGTPPRWRRGDAVHGFDPRGKIFHRDSLVMANDPIGQPMTLIVLAGAPSSAKRNLPAALDACCRRLGTPVTGGHRTLWRKLRCRVSEVAGAGLNENPRVGFVLRVTVAGLWPSARIWPFESACHAECGERVCASYRGALCRVGPALHPMTFPLICGSGRRRLQESQQFSDMLAECADCAL